MVLARTVPGAKLAFYGVPHEWQERNAAKEKIP
jgi:hypothetical protein